MKLRAAVTVAIAALILSPLARPRGWDDFPISSYPMFSRGDIGTVVTLAHALVVHADDTRTPAPPALVGTAEPMVATAIVNRAISNGTAAELCRAIASRATEGIAIELAFSTYDTTAYFREKNRTPLARIVHARCEIAKR